MHFLAMLSRLLRQGDRILITGDIITFVPDAFSLH
ncbi:hypothetical protein NIES4075_13780 [Tolypothrix sp. NIES-4075]|nr:hypothetical protein NIES4075_13780 [Tolypothrix sp. NIES-4075]